MPAYVFLHGHGQPVFLPKERDKMGPFLARAKDNKGIIECSDDQDNPGGLMRNEIAGFFFIEADKYEAEEKKRAEEQEKQKAEREAMKAALKTDADYQAVVRHNEDLIKRTETAEKNFHESVKAEAWRMRQLALCADAATGRVLREAPDDWSVEYETVRALRLKYDTLTAAGVKGWLRRVFWKRGRG